MNADRVQQVEAAWRRSTSQASFWYKLPVVMVESFYYDEDYEEVRTHLVSTYGGRDDVSAQVYD